MSATAPTHEAKCDFCENNARHLDNKGWVYCDNHKIAGRGRPLRVWERRWIAAGKQLPSYKPGPEPKEA